MLHMPCQMQEMHKWKLYICYEGAPTNKAHKPSTPRGEAKKQRSKKTHKLPLNTCIRFKEYTKLTLYTWDRARSKTNQVAWPRPHTWRSQIHLPLPFLQKSLTLSSIPESDVPPCHHRAMRPKNHPDLNQMFSGPPTCISKPRTRASKWLNTGVSSKSGC
jgi:hypothetical protein